MQAMRLVTLIGLGAAVVLGGRLALAQPSLASVPPDSPPLATATETLGTAHTAAIAHDPEAGELVVLHGPVDLPAASGDHAHGAHASGEAIFPDVAEVTVPFDASVFAFYVDLVDRHGDPVPPEVLHHVNLVDPDQRELFAPISMRMAAAGRETGVKSVPPRLFGLPVREGQRLAIHTMLHNPSDTPYEGVTLRFHLRLAPDDMAGPFFQVYPFWVDVQLPAGDKTFDLPPGRSTQSYEAEPAVAGRILALSGHMHEHAVGLRFENATTGEVLWEAEPELNPDGSVANVPIGRPFLHLGEPVSPEHTYRLTVEYDNPTGETIPDGGMGSIGGIFLPEEDTVWPGVDPSLEIYQLDLKHYYREIFGKLDDLRAAAAEAPEHADHADHAGHDR